MTSPISDRRNAAHPKDAANALLIRKAENDVDFRACLSFIRAHIEVLKIPEAASYLAVSTASLATAYNGPAAGFLLCSRANAHNIGCIAYKPLLGGIAQFNYFYVQPDQRGCGIGRVLLESALSAARKAGFEEVVLSTLPKLRSAQALYKDFGFSETDAIFEDLPGAIFYRKSLS